MMLTSLAFLVSLGVQQPAPAQVAPPAPVYQTVSAKPAKSVRVGPIVGGVASLATGLVGLAGSVVVGGISALLLTAITLRYMDWDKGSFTLEEDIRANVSDALPFVLWTWSGYAAVANVFVAMFASVFAAVGLGVLVGYGISTAVE